MTNQPSMIDIIENAQRLSSQSDRVAMFALGLFGIVAALFAIRYLAAKDDRNSEHLEKLANELRAVVENNSIQVQLCKESINRNTYALEAFERSTGTQRITR